MIVDIDAGIAVSLVTAAATLGIALGRQAAHGERIKALERFRERIAERVERLEKMVAVDRVRIGTRGGGIPLVVPEEESSSDT